MGVLHSLYGRRINDSRYRQKWLLKDSQNVFLFLSVEKKSSKLVLDCSLPLTGVNVKDKTGYMIKAARYL